MAIVNDETLGVRHPMVRRARILPRDGMDYVWTVLVGVVMLVVLGLMSSVKLSWLNSLMVLPFIAVYFVTMYTPDSNTFNERIYRMPVIIIQDKILQLKNYEVFRSLQSIEIERYIADRVHEEELTTASTKRAIITVDDISLDVIADDEFILGSEDLRRLEKAYPLKVKGLKTDDKTIGLIYNREKLTYTTVFSMDGSALRDSSQREQFNALKRLGNLIKKETAVAGFRGFCISMGIRNRPQDQWLIPSKLQEVCDPDVILPHVIAYDIPEEQWTQDDYMDVSLHNLQGGFAELTVQSHSVDMLIAITVRENDALKKAFESSSLSESEFRRLPIIRLQSDMLPILEGIYGGEVTVLDVPAAERHLRLSRDVATLFSFFNDAQLSKTIRREQAESGESVEIDAAQYNRYLPKSHIISKKDWLNVDNTYAAVLDLTTFPNDTVFAHQMPSLADAASVYSSFTLIGQTAKSGLEYLVGTHGTDMVDQVKEKVLAPPIGSRAERKAIAKNEYLEEIDVGGAVQNFVLRFATLATSRDELESQLEDDIARFMQEGLGPIRISHSSQQWRKFLTTTTLIDCEV